MNTETATFSVSKEYFPPKVGGQSLVGINTRAPFPLGFGNYFWLKGGPYVVNFWAENLEEWASRNPDITSIEVTVLREGENELGIITDDRLKEWCNKRLCVTGHGYGSRRMLDAIVEHTGLPHTLTFCGCESDDELPHVLESAWPGLKRQCTCRRCQREWTELFTKP